MSLRERLAEPEILVAVGAHDPFTALIAQRSGVEAIFLGGYSVAAHLHGLPDIGFIGLSDVLEVLERITAVSSIPVVVDADTGFGSEASVRRTIDRLERAGAAGVQIEDQVFPKRCGYMEGKRVIPREEMVAKVRAAVEARSGDDLLLLARTDAMAVTGIDDAVDRARAYADAGADLVVVDAVTSLEQIEILAERIDAPRLAPMPAMQTDITVGDLQRLGYRMTVFPSTLGSWLIAKTYGALCEEIVRSGTGGALLDGFTDLEELHAITDRAGWERPVTGEPFEPPARSAGAVAQPPSR